MNESDKTIIKRFHQKLAEDIIVDDDLLGHLYQEGVFAKGMNELIRAQATSTGKIQKLLELLPKRGPSALTKFINFLENSYPWLATLLSSAQESAEQQQGKVARNGNAAVNNSKRLSSSTSTFDQGLLVDTDIKNIVAAYVHKQFGQSKRISEKDKKSVDRFLSDQIQGERNRYQRLLMSPSETPGISRLDTPDDVFSGLEISDKLYSIHLKMEPLIRYERADCGPNSEYIGGDDDGHPDYRHQQRRQKQNSYMPKLLKEDMDFDLISTEVDYIVGEVEGLNGRLNDCLRYFESEDHHQPLSYLVERVVRQCRAWEEESVDDRRQISTLLNDRDKQSDAIQHLQTEGLDLRKHIQANTMDMASLRKERSELKSKVNELEHTLSVWKQQHQQQHQHHTSSSLRLGIVSKAAQKTPRGSVGTVSTSMTGGVSMGQTMPAGGGAVGKGTQRPGNSYLNYARRGTQAGNRYGMAVVKKKMTRSDTNLSSTAKF